MPGVAGLAKALQTMDFEVGVVCFKESYLATPFFYCGQIRGIPLIEL